jgi:hypothetical protein
MLAHFEAQRRAVSVFEGEHRAAVARAKALTEAFRRAKEAAEEEHPLDAAARAAFADLPDDRCGGGGMRWWWGGGIYVCVGCVCVFVGMCVRDV